jgi:hypothetical protein
MPAMVVGMTVVRCRIRAHGVPATSDDGRVIAVGDHGAAR